MEADINQIKTKMAELLDLSKGAFQSHTRENIMSAKEAADLLRLNVNVIYSKCSRSEMPFFKMGKLYKFKKSEVLEWVKRQGENDAFSVDDYVNRYLQANT